MPKIIIIGGGGTGAALAHDLLLRGFTVSLFEKGELLSGTTGRHHGLLHSGARYAVHDPEAAKECITENLILRRLAPEAIEPNDGLFVAIDDKDFHYRHVFVEGCHACDIPVRQISKDVALAMEPELHPALRLAFQVPDAVMDAWRLPMYFFATARANGGEIRPFCEIIGIHKTAGRVNGVKIFDHRRLCEYNISGDLVVNAAGPWASKVAATAGVQLPIRPGPGIMVAIKARLTDMVINRLHKAAEGDIIVPQRQLSILGTSLWLTENPDAIGLPGDHIQNMFDLCSQMVPAVKKYPVHAVWSAARPLIAEKVAGSPQEISRSFAVYDHGPRDHLEGLISIIGGKATTLRVMAEKTADLICRKTGRNIPCNTKQYKLLHYRHFFQEA